jgi:multiple sugar transport system substrate-binding protein
MVAGIDARSPHIGFLPPRLSLEVSARQVKRRQHTLDHPRKSSYEDESPPLSFGRQAGAALPTKQRRKVTMKTIKGNWKTARLTRREFLTASALGAAAGVVLVACGPAPTAEAPPATAPPAATPAPKAAQKVRVLMNNQGDWNKPMQDFFNPWTEQTGIQSEWNFSGEWNQNFITQFAAGTPPDITYTFGLGQFAERDALMPLDEIWARDGIKGSDFVLGMTEMATYKGKIYAMPAAVDFTPLFWNKDAFKEAGLDPEVPPKTLDETTEFSNKLLKKDEQGNILRLGLDPTSFDEWYTYWSAIMGISWWDAQNQQVTLNTPEAVKYLEWAVENVKRWGGSEAIMAFRSGKPSKYDFENNPFALGELALMLNGWWMGAPFQEFYPDMKYGVALPPTMNGKPEEQANYPTGGWHLAIANGKNVNVEGAWSLLKYGFWEHPAEFAASSTNGCCVLSQMDKFTELAKQSLKGSQMEPYFDVFPEYGKLSKRVASPTFPVSDFAAEQMSRTYEAAILGQKSPKDALDEAQQATEAELKRVLSGS